MQTWQLSSISDEMKAERRRIAILSLLAVAALVLAVACHSAMTGTNDAIAMERVILQGEDPSALAELVADAGGQTTHELAIIGAIAADVPVAELARVKASPAVRRSYGDGSVTLAGTPQPDTFYPTMIGADKLHSQGFTGSGVTVAVLDTGAWEGGQLSRDTGSSWRIKGHYNAISDNFDPYGSSDGNGHGTHVASVIASSGKTRKGKL
jgi:subtilisin family serine protease